MNTLPSSLDQETSLYEGVLADISSGVLVGGQRLKVAELASRYGVSTSPVREVLRRMQGEGYVDISPNRGATIRKADANTIQNIFELLQLLEPYFVTWFAEFADPEMIQELERIQQKIESITEADITNFRKLDAEFHGVICKRHYNRQAAETWHHLRRSLNVYGAQLKIRSTRFAAIIAEHKELIDAFRANDVERAARAIRIHLEGSFAQMSQQMRMIGLSD